VAAGLPLIVGGALIAGGGGGGGGGGLTAAGEPPPPHAISNELAKRDVIILRMELFLSSDLAVGICSRTAVFSAFRLVFIVTTCKQRDKLF